MPQEVLMSLMDGDMPFTNQFGLPSIVACPGGCEGKLYCSQSCADSDWETYHSLLCAGSKTEPLWRSALEKFVEHANAKRLKTDTEDKEQSADEACCDHLSETTRPYLCTGFDIYLVWEPCTLFPGSTSLHLAARSGSLDCICRLLAWGADRLQRDSAGLGESDA